MSSWETPHRPRRWGMRAAVWFVAVGILTALGYGQVRRYQVAMAPVWQEEGRTLYWHVRRTWHTFRPFTLVHELYARAEDKPTVLRFLDIRQGQTVADVGCGSGYFTLDLARAAGPTGQVFALDIQAESLAFFEERLARLGCERCAPIQTWQNEVSDAMLPPASTDVELIANLDFYSYKDLLSENVRMIQSCFAGLRPGGRAVVVQDLSINPGSRAEYIQANFEAAGFQTVDRHDFEEPSVLFVFRRPME